MSNKKTEVVEVEQKTKVIKAHVLDADGDLVTTLIEVPDVPSDKRRAYNPAVDKISAGGMSKGSVAASKDDKISVTGF